MRSIPLLCAAVAFSLSAYASDDKSAKKPTDPEIAAIVVTANQIDIDAGKLAQSKSTNAQVKELGRLMVTDHRAMNEQVHQAAQQANVVSRAGDEAEDIGDDGREMMEELRGKRGAEFDREYMDEMVDSHEEALEMLDRAARDTARAAPIREAVTQSRQKVQQHLDQARRLQQQLKQGS